MAFSLSSINVYVEKLNPIFSNSRSTAEIQDAVESTLSQVQLNSDEEYLEVMINLLIDTRLEDDEGAVGFSNVVEIPCEDCPSGSIYEALSEMLPDADPDYIKREAKRFEESKTDDVGQFIEDNLKNRTYPKYEEYLKRQELSEEKNKLIFTFNIEDFVEQFPDTIQVFTNPDRPCALAGDDVSEEDINYALTFLYNHFAFLRRKDIKRAFNANGKDLIKCCSRLRKFPNAFLKPRQLLGQNDTDNWKLLQEITFIEHETEIRQFIKRKDECYCAMLEEARKYNLLEECLCCFDSELIPEEVYFCNKNCAFCKDCVKKGAEVELGLGKTSITCLAGCGGEFSLQILKLVLDKKIFQRLCQKIQMEEIKKANIDGLESCPYCPFATIPIEGDKIFKCLNPECLKETCRECWHPAHIPKRCSEIEYDEDVKMRTFIENKMTDALLRTCWKCQKKFYKSTGCNKMTCICGALMCYLCGAAVTNYNHFHTGQCQLFTDDKQLHRDQILAGALAAKKELGVVENPTKLKFDPALNLTDLA